MPQSGGEPSQFTLCRDRALNRYSLVGFPLVSVFFLTKPALLAGGDLRPLFLPVGCLQSCLAMNDIGLCTLYDAVLLKAVVPKFESVCGTAPYTI
jgi:hypothetical protein